MEIEGRIRKVLELAAGKQIDIARDESVFESGLLDSFALVDVVAALETEFSVKIPDSDLIPQRFDTIAKIEQYLAARERG